MDDACASFTDPYSDSLKHATSAPCLIETITNPNWPFSYTATLSFPDLAGSSAACEAENAHGYGRSKTASGWGPLYYIPEHAKIVGSECQATVLFPDNLPEPNFLVRYSIYADPPAANMRITSKVIPYVP
jgi:hypothetical protein